MTVARRAGFLMLLAAAPAPIGGCGNGGSPAEPRPAATLTAPSFTTVPGQRANEDLLLRTNRPSAGLQVEVVGPPEVVVEGVQATGRASGLESSAFQNLAPGRARVLLFDLAGAAAIPAGAGPVLTLTFRTATGAPGGDFPLELENGLVVDQNGEAFDLTLEDGRVSVQR
jgi:hypothetical protein